MTTTPTTPPSPADGGADPAATAVVIMASGSTDLLRDAVAAASEQTQPHTTVVAVPSDDVALAALARSLPGAALVVSGPSTTARRNAALDAAPGATAVVFLDDDAVVRADHVEQVVAFLAANPDVVALTGRVLADGSTGQPLTRAVAQTALAASEAEPLTGASRPADDVYSRAFAVRRVLADGRPVPERFDERLTGDGWLEAVDLARRLQRHGRLVHAADAKVVVLGSAAASSRADAAAQGQLGYAQVAHPLHLRRTGSLTGKTAVTELLRPLVANAAGSLRGEDVAWRRQRLRGGMRALVDAARGRVTPERA